jgi:hypothetical protein
MMGDWTFFSNYGHVLVCLARNSEARLRDVALQVGITERAVQKIVKDMQDAGILMVTKQGRCNRYRINKRKSLRHGLESHCNVGKLLALVAVKPVKTSQLVIEPNVGQREAPPALPQPVAAEPRLEAEPGKVLKQPEKKKPASKKSASKKSVKEIEAIDVRQQGKLF